MEAILEPLTDEEKYKIFTFQKVERDYPGKGWLHPSPIRDPIIASRLEKKAILPNIAFPNNNKVPGITLPNIAFPNNNKVPLHDIPLSKSKPRFIYESHNQDVISTNLNKIRNHVMDKIANSRRKEEDEDEDEDDDDEDICSDFDKSEYYILATSRNETDHLFARYAIKVLGKNIVCSDIKHWVIWFFCNKTKLWKIGGKDTLINHIVKKLHPIGISETSKFYEYIKNQDLYPSDKRYKELIKTWKVLVKITKSIGTVATGTKLALLVKERLYDESFIDKLDSAKDILAIKDNLVIDLRTGLTRPRVKEDYCTFVCPVRFDPGARSEMFEKFLDDITLGNVELQRFLQRILGLCLTGETNLHQMYIFYGPLASNGKSTLMDLMSHVLGGYYLQASREVFIETKGCAAGSASPHLAELRGKRMVVFSETKPTDKLNEGQIKAMTGGDRIKGRALFQSPIEFSGHFKAFVLTNHQPICSTDEGLWRRLIMIPFDCKFVDKVGEEGLLPHERIKNLTFKDDFLSSDSAMSSLFNWLVEGAVLHYQNPSISIPKVIGNTTNIYKEEQDVYQMFISQILEGPSDGYEIQASILYDEFKKWFLTNYSEKPPSSTLFGKEIKKHLTKTKKSKGCIWYLDYRLNIITL